MSESFITLDFTIPNHTEEIKKGAEAIEKLKHKIANIHDKKSITDINHDLIYEEIVRVLDYLGHLSTPLFAMSDDLEKLYFKHYHNTPALAKTLWLEHYEYLHHDYNTLKNRCFRLLEELDDEYINVHKKFPPNWSSK
jgi:hypothetical protein